MRDQVHFEEVDPCAKRSRPRRRRASDPVTDVVDRVVAFGRVDEHSLHALRDQRIGERVDNGDKRPRIRGHQRRVGRTIRQRSERRGGARARLCEQRQRVVQSRFVARTGTVRQHEDGRADHFHDVMRAKLVTGVSEDKNPRCTRIQKIRGVIRHQ